VNEAKLVYTLELADQIIRQQRRDLLATGAQIRLYEQRITALEKQREHAERRAAESDQEVEAGRGREAALEERCRELEAAVQALEAEPVVTTSGVFGVDDDAVEAFEFLDDEQQEALRYRIRCEQAVRARLAKTDMSPSARLRTLQQAKQLGLLDRRLRQELRELQEDGW
jgi:hypothetical protein